MVACSRSNLCQDSESQSCQSAWKQQPFAVNSIQSVRVRQYSAPKNSLQIYRPAHCSVTRHTLKPCFAQNVQHMYCNISTTRNSSGDEIANVNFLRRHRTRTTAHNKVHFTYGKHTCPQLPNAVSYL